jgi:hypothetical protein
MTSTHLAADAFTDLSWLLALGWLWQAVAALRGMPTLPDLTRGGAAAPDLTSREGRISP